MKRLLLLPVFALLFACTPVRQTINVVPYPNEVTFRNGVYELTDRSALSRTEWQNSWTVQALLEAGKDADIVIFGDNVEVFATIVSGRKEYQK